MSAGTFALTILFPVMLLLLLLLPQTIICMLWSLYGIR